MVPAAGGQLGGRKMIEGYTRLEFKDKDLQKAAGEAFMKNSITLVQIRIAINADGKITMNLGQTLAEGKTCEFFLGADGTRQFQKELDAALSVSHELQKCVQHMGEIMVRHYLDKAMGNDKKADH
jgi:hypothetical protein